MIPLSGCSLLNRERTRDPKGRENDRLDVVVALAQAAPVVLGSEQAPLSGRTISTLSKVNERASLFLLPRAL